MFLLKEFVVLGFFVSLLTAQPVELSSGFYHDISKKDSIEVDVKSDKIDLELSNGSKLRFILQNGKHKMDNLSGDGYTAIKILGSDNFQIYYDHQDPSSGSVINNYKLYKRPGLLNKIIAALVASALLFSVFQFYLKLNKVWKRRGISEVAESISIVASLLGFVTLVPFLLNSILISQDYPSSVKYILGLILATVFTLISMGYFVAENRDKNFFRILINALSAEKNESTDLLSAMLRPHGANKIIEILTQLAAIDDDVAQEEIDLINEFAERWGISIPELKVGKPEEVTNLIELKDLVQSYLDEKPDVEVAQNLVDLINMMAEADDEVTEEEAMAVGEFTGMIAHYVSQEEGGPVDAYEVAIVPQNDEQSDSVKELLMAKKAVKKRGGEVFIVGTFYSEDYASAVCDKYISLGLYTNYIKVVLEA